MNLANQQVTVILTDEAVQILLLASIVASDSGLIRVTVEESEDLGLWIRVPREDDTHLFLLRWEYVLGIDMPRSLGKVVGLRKV